MKSREEEIKNLLDSDTTDESEETDTQQLEQLSEIEALKKGDLIKNHRESKGSNHALTPYAKNKFARKDEHLFVCLMMESL